MFFNLPICELYKFKEQIITMFSMYRSQKNIQNKAIDYKALYLQQKRLKEEFQKRAQIAQLRYRKLAQSVNKKCVRCMNIDDKNTKEDKILQLKQFTNGLNLLNMGSMAHIPKVDKSQHQKLIQNFGIFGVPESMLIQPDHFDDFTEGELLFVSSMPTVVQQHAAKLTFPSGVSPKYFVGTQAKQKAIQIMSSSSNLAKNFIMGFEGSKEEDEMLCQVKRIMNPENKLFAICLAVQDFSLVPNWKGDLIESEKIVNTQKNQMLSAKVLSCQQTDISYHSQRQCSIAIAPRVYCIFSHYPFFNFYQQLLRAMINSVKTQRLVIYRQSGCALAEADSHFFLERVKQTFKQISNQLETWQIKLARQYELKLINCQKIPFAIGLEGCASNFVQDWGLSIFNMFNLDTFVDVFTLIMLQQKVVFVSDNPTILTYTIHLFSQLLPKPFKYPYPVISILPQNQGYFETLCPFVYGVLCSKKNFIAKQIVENFPNAYIFLQKEGIQIIYEEKKNVLKKRPKKLRDSLASKFKPAAEKNRRVSTLTFTEEQINFQKDKQGICLQILKQVNTFLQQQVMKLLPKEYEVEQMFQNIAANGIKAGQDINQVVFNKIKKDCHSKSKDQFYRALLETQIVSTHLFK